MATGNAGFFETLNEVNPTLVYVAFDPGKSTGIAAWEDPTEAPIVMGLEVDETGLDLFFDFLDKQETPPKVFILEEYRVFNEKFNHQGDKVLTAQRIGEIKAWARRHGTQVVEQRPDRLRTGLTWAGVDIPRGHPADWLSAFGHGYFYLYNNDLIKTSRVLQERRPLGAKVIDNE